MDIEDKELLAKFMGWGYSDQLELYSTPIALCLGTDPWCSVEEDWSSVLPASDIPFDTKWEWLMLVVDKIEDTHMPWSLNYFNVAIKKDSCIIGAPLGTTGKEYVFVIALDHQSSSKIGMVGYAVTSFIKLYNKQWKCCKQ